MFQKRSIVMKVVKTPKSAAPTDPCVPTRRSPAEIEANIKLAEETVKKVAILVGLGYAGKRLVDVSSEIALIAANTKIK